MRITRQQLTDLINEEISSALLERQNRRLLEAAVPGMSHTSAYDMVEFAKAYMELPRDLRKVLDFVMEGRGENVTLEEVQDLHDILTGYNSELDDYLKEALAAAQVYYDEEDEDDGTWAAAVRANR
jgi:hypothetical protein